MNSLNFINKEIKATQKSYSAFDLDYMLFGKESDKKESERLLKKLKHLQQVKAELEAWEVVKKNMGQNENENGYEMNIIFYFDEDYQTLKKALEVEEND